MGRDGPVCKGLMSLAMRNGEEQRPKNIEFLPEAAQTTATLVSSSCFLVLFNYY